MHSSLHFFGPDWQLVLVAIASAGAVSGILLEGLDVSGARVRRRRARAESARRDQTDIGCRSAVGPCPPRTLCHGPPLFLDHSGRSQATGESTTAFWSATDNGIVVPRQWRPSITEYLIRCVNTQRPHHHITSADVQELSGDSYGDSKTLLVGTIRTKLASGDRFNTYSPSTDQMADIHSDTCSTAGCQVQTIRSDSDAFADNNLDNLRCHG